MNVATRVAVAIEFAKPLTGDAFSDIEELRQLKNSKPPTRADLRGNASRNKRYLA